MTLGAASRSSRLTASLKAAALAMAPPARMQSTKAGVTYAMQDTLPHLPIPDVQQTAAKFLDIARPFVSDCAPGAPVAGEEHQTEEYKRLKEAVEDFKTSPLVAELQKRLQQHAKGKESWLIDWFNSANYFGFRDPIVPWVNYYYVHKDDRTRRNGPARAAALIRSMLYFRRMLINEVLEPEKTAKGALDMSTYEFLFNSCRIPAKGDDTTQTYNPSTHNHIVVVRKGRFFEVPVIDSHGEFVSAADLQRQFERIQQTATEPAEHPLGILTAENRDTWLAARQALLNASSSNSAALDRIQSAIMILALDDNRPVSREAISRGVWIGDGQSRFFDKHQLIVFDNGRSGFNGEHSSMDGTPTSRLNDWMLNSLAARKIDMGNPTVSSDSQLGEVSEIKFALNEEVKKYIQQAKVNFEKELSQHKITVLQYNGYGKDTIKKLKTSPDSWAQLVIQYAYYKLSGYTALAGTYESAQTRKFRRGRTEVIRTAGPDTLAWVKSMEDNDASDKMKVDLFRKAASAHIRYAGSAADGQGIDRHFFGLKKLLKEGEELPKIYNDPAFVKSSHWVLSTSQLSSEFFDGWGYGQVVSDGLGLAYSVNNTNLRFTITTTNGMGEDLKQYLAEAAEEVKELVERVMSQDEAPKAKL